MTTYRVTWEIDVEADTPREAAERARDYQQDPDALVHVYDVRARGEAGIVRVDLDEDEEASS